MSVSDLLITVTVIFLIILALIIDSFMIAIVFIINFAIARYVTLPILYWLLGLFNVKPGLDENLLAALIATIQILTLGIKGIASKVKEKKVQKEGQGYIM